MRAVLMLLVALAAGACAPPPSSIDPVYGRLAVVLTPAERGFLLEEMRHFVLAIRGITDGIADNDMQSVAAAARSAGVEVYRARIARPGARTAGLEDKLPPEFRALDLATRAAFDDMALHARQGGDRDHLLAAMADNLRRCVACHAAYRFPQ